MMHAGETLQSEAMRFRRQADLGPGPGTLLDKVDLGLAPQAAPGVGPRSQGSAGPEVAPGALR